MSSLNQYQFIAKYGEDNKIRRQSIKNKNNLNRSWNNLMNNAKPETIKNCISVEKNNL